MTRQAYVGTRPRFAWLAALSATGLLACASPAPSNGTGGSSGATGGTTGTGGTHTGGTSGGSTGGTSGGSTGGTSGGSTGGINGTGGTSGGSTGGTSGGSTGGSGGHATGGAAGGTSGGTGGSTTGVGGNCGNADTTSINIDASGYICNNQWGIKGAWYCYSSDTSSPCNPTGVIPYNSTSKGMCLSGSIANGGYDGLGFKVNSGPPGDSTTPGTWNGSSIVGFAITLTSGASGRGSGGSVVELEYPTPNDLDNPQTTKDAPGVTLPGVPGTGSVTYNVLYSDAVLANNSMYRKSVDQQNLTDVKLLIPPDTQSNTIAYDFCVTKVVPLMTAPSPVVPTGSYGPQWSNRFGQAVNGVNGYAVQTAPFDSNNGLPMTMQVMATATGVGFTYTAKSGASGNSPASFPAIVSGWGPGEKGIQLYGPYQADKTISALTSVKSSWSFSVGGSGDAAYDIWLGTSKAPTTAPSVELMIWLNNGGKQPLGNTTASTAVTGSDGVARFAHTGQANSTGQQVVSYVPTSGTATSVTNLDILQYLKDAVSNGYAGLNKDATKVYLLGVQAGFEVYSADTWKTTDYNISIQ
ncbi:MAG TPA: hypothetical protein VMT03_12925 [Polyangia bacterium]|nr:hypothetical protein [Polyangia bacterium]